ncbi:arginyltransferase [Leptospira fluminis]|uniref:Arginyltransferase n=1 Tax=Leptospira fluminis TaxID=2484979 RepID=A0A4R9GMX6_9LEPT|nr:arginyltransferase [Leptospira fluminis]TGK17429.1 arginyltransferase [Leptospira fluminis]
MNAGYLRFLESIPSSPPGECSYYPDRISKVKGFLSKKPPNLSALDFLLASGFRRSGELFYRTACDSCIHCLSYRIPLHQFTISKSLKRLGKRNVDLIPSVHSPEMTPEKAELYVKYQNARHPGSYGNTDSELQETMFGQMYLGSENSVELQIRKEGRLLGWILLDCGEVAVSAVYSVFDSEFHTRSLGKFLILASLLWAKEKGFLEYHLGLFLPGHPKMDYKGFWKPAEILDQRTGNWIESRKFLADYLEKAGQDGSRSEPKSPYDT